MSEALKYSRKNLEQCLVTHWRYPKFRPNQIEICSSVLEGKDSFVLMATGSGKSICYQLPPVYLNDIGIPSCGIVVSPLISLMEDQVSGLQKIGIKAELLGNSASVDISARNGEYTILYITPEKLLNWSDGIREILTKKRITCIAIDEAHCVSEWGHDFRPSYRNLSNIRESFPNIPIIALTATCTTMVAMDIISHLHLTTPFLVRANFNRPNLYYKVVTCASSGSRELVNYVGNFYHEQLAVVSAHKIHDQIHSSITREQETSNSYITRTISSIIYTSTQNDAESLYKDMSNHRYMTQHHIKIGYYHAGLTLSKRKEIQHDFYTNRIHIIVATIAFGMGIDKPDVRLVVNYGIPSSLAHYYQQTGRAGRDGLRSDCVLFYHRSNLVKLAKLQNYGINKQSGIRSNISDASANTTQLEEMKKYCIDCNDIAPSDKMDSQQIVCRRSYLLQHFLGEPKKFNGNRHQSLQWHIDDFSTVNNNNSVSICKSISTDMKNYFTGTCCDLCDMRALWLKQNKTMLASDNAVATSTRSDGENWVTPVSQLTTCALNSNNEVSSVDLGNEIRILLQGISQCGEHYGLNVPIGVVLGCNDKQTQKVKNYSKLSVFGVGKDLPRAWWTALAHQLVDIEKLLESKLVQLNNQYGSNNSGGGARRFTYEKYCLTPKGRTFLNQRFVSSASSSQEVRRVTLLKCYPEYRHISYMIKPCRELQQLQWIYTRKMTSLSTVPIETKSSYDPKDCHESADEYSVKSTCGDNFQTPAKLNATPFGGLLMQPETCSSDFIDISEDECKYTLQEGERDNTNKNSPLSYNKQVLRTCIGTVTNLSDNANRYKSASLSGSVMTGKSLSLPTRLNVNISQQESVKCPISVIGKRKIDSCSDSPKMENKSMLSAELIMLLESRLRQLRSNISTRLGKDLYPPYVILSTDSMTSMVKESSTIMSTYMKSFSATATSFDFPNGSVGTSPLKNITGWNDEKITKFGDEFIKCIRDFYQEMGIAVGGGDNDGAVVEEKTIDEEKLDQIHTVLGVADDTSSIKETFFIESHKRSCVTVCGDVCGRDFARNYDAAAEEITVNISEPASRSQAVENHTETLSSTLIEENDKSVTLQSESVMRSAPKKNPRQMLMGINLGKKQVVSTKIMRNNTCPTPTKMQTTEISQLSLEKHIFEVPVVKMCTSIDSNIVVGQGVRSGLAVKENLPEIIEKVQEKLRRRFIGVGTIVSVKDGSISWSELVLFAMSSVSKWKSMSSKPSLSSSPSVHQCDSVKSDVGSNEDGCTFNDILQYILDDYLQSNQIVLHFIPLLRDALWMLSEYMMIYEENGKYCVSVD